ncbi:beta-ketoacyl synthase family protein [Mizugakiibacter sediminis]|uniref:Beta-ketoacyl synthase family protein n=1 Tax=Mizugakiibacter sediminis TaxID=1475481 RepID=A0A0K8QJ66_9GAMM|nr:beta-ketoacyl synthase chain length factor [Mizugakiibacter sediminis]GAP64869.1 beta-ketoacyl synthase family protein [Mizugakiibacter sediminis]
MSATLTLWVEGIGLWAPGLPSWPALRALCAGGAPSECAARPAAAVLPPGERRRAPESVLLAVEAAGQAVAMSAREARELPCVFSSAHGDLAIMDYMCATLAAAPAELSPTKFHNSVHNAAAGYWTIASGCMAPSTALAAHAHSFGAGLLEAATQACAERRAVLYVGYDAVSQGPLAEMAPSSQPFAAALVLAPAPGAAACARLTLGIGAEAAPAAPRHPALAALAAANPSAGGLALLEALAADAPAALALAAGPHFHLTVHLEPSR